MNAKKTAHITQSIELEISSLESQKPLVFLSYAKEDKEKVWNIYREMKTEQLNPWLDVANLFAGQNWDSAISKAIRNARFVIVFLSSHSVSKRGYVQKEIKEALDVAEQMPEDEIFIIPVRLEECVVPERLSKWQWIDIFHQQSYRNIINILKSHLGHEAVSPAVMKVTGKLIVIKEEQTQAIFELNNTANLIGRSTAAFQPDIDLARFEPRSVSRRHAIIFREQDSFIIKDFGSTNGTVINDTLLLRTNQPYILRHGDKIRLGEIVIRFIIDTQII